MYYTSMLEERVPMTSRIGVVTRKGQITIPADLRKELGIEIGDRVHFERDVTGIHIEKERELGKRLVRETAGMFRSFVDRSHLTSQEIIDLDKETFAQAIIDDWNTTESRIRSDADPQ